MITNITNYTQAYTEFNCLLECMPETYVEKLPKKLINLIKNKSDEDFSIYIDTNKSLLEQGFSQQTKDLIAVINYNYWSTEEEKKQLKNVFNENEKKYQAKLMEEYNPNNIFKKKTQQYEHSKSIDSNNQILVYKENLFTKILNLLKRFFHK